MAGHWFKGFERVHVARLVLEDVRRDLRVQRVLRITQNRHTDEELTALRRAFHPECRVREIAPTLRDADHVALLLQEHNPDDFMLVAPYTMLDALTKMGHYPLHVKMRGRRFLSLHRLRAVEVQTTPL